MCAGCAIAAASAASGFRSWLQGRHFRWLTPRRLKALTISAICAAAIVSSVGISGSSRASAGAPHAASAQQR
jgi:membrane protease YdiL (CAAX protease family)